MNPLVNTILYEQLVMIIFMSKLHYSITNKSLLGEKHLEHIILCQYNGFKVRKKFLFLTQPQEETVKVSKRKYMVRSCFGNNYSLDEVRE